MHISKIRFARLLSYLFMYVLSLQLEDFADCLYICYRATEPPTYIPEHANFSESVRVPM